MATMTVAKALNAGLRRALEVLKGEIESALAGEGDMTQRVERLIRAIQRCAKEHPYYNVMYNEITAGASSAYAAQLAAEIEGISARNQIEGTVVKVQEGAVNGHVTIEDEEGARISGSITNESIGTLGLKEGGKAVAIVKATDVMVAVD